STQSGCLTPSSETKEFQRDSLVQSHMIALVALDLILRVVLARMVYVALVGHILLMHPDDPAADVTGFRVPRDVIANLECLCHHPVFPDERPRRSCVTG